MRACGVNGCQQRTSAFGRYCNGHKTRARRHGHPAQLAVTKPQLGPYLKAGRRRIKKNADSPLWSALEGRWEALVTYCKGEVAEHRTGRPFIRHVRQAAIAVVKIAEDVKARDVIETVIALYLMQDQEPRRFRSDRAFQAQLVRRVRALTERNIGVYWSAADGRNKRVYRDLPPKVAAVMGQWLAEAFGSAGLKVALLERNEAEATTAERRAVLDALAKLK
jgi:hypothetical protein